MPAAAWALFRSPILHSEVPPISLSGIGSDFVGGTSDASTSATVSAGQTAIYHLQLTGENGFAGNVTIACADTVPVSQCTPSQTGPIAINETAVGFTVQVSTE